MHVFLVYKFHIISYLYSFTHTFLNIILFPKITVYMNERLIQILPLETN